jgi:hypothetical protein
LLFAGYAVSVTVEGAPVSGFAFIDGGGSGGPRLGAVRVVHVLHDWRWGRGLGLGRGLDDRFGLRLGLGFWGGGDRDDDRGRPDGLGDGPRGGDGRGDGRGGCGDGLRVAAGLDEDDEQEEP